MYRKVRFLKKGFSGTCSYERKIVTCGSYSDRQDLLLSGIKIRNSGLVP